MVPLRRGAASARFCLVAVKCKNWLFGRETQPEAVKFSHQKISIDGQSFGFSRDRSLKVRGPRGCPVFARKRFSPEETTNFKVMFSSSQMELSF